MKCLIVYLYGNIVIKHNNMHDARMAEILLLHKQFFGTLVEFPSNFQNIAISADILPV